MGASRRVLRRGAEGQALSVCTGFRLKFNFSRVHGKCPSTNEKDLTSSRLAMLCGCTELGWHLEGQCLIHSRFVDTMARESIESFLQFLVYILSITWGPTGCSMI